MKRLSKEERHQIMIRELRKKPFLTDQDLSEILGVSVATVRLDRQTLGIPQLRDRMQKMAQDVSSQPMDLRSDVQIIDLTPGEKELL